VEAQQSEVQQGEAQQAPTVNERSPVTKDITRQQEAKKNTIVQQEPKTEISSQHDAGMDSYNVALRAEQQLGSTDILARLAFAVKSRADCNP
jgi:hypothetical protein